MDQVMILNRVSRMVEELAGEDEDHTELEKSKIMCAAFTNLTAIAVLTHCDIAKLPPKKVFGDMMDNVEDVIAQMILDETCQPE